MNKHPRMHKHNSWGRGASGLQRAGTTLRQKQRQSVDEDNAKTAAILEWLHDSGICERRYKDASCSELIKECINFCYGIMHIQAARVNVSLNAT